MSIGERVRAIRKERGWTRVEAARRAQVTRQTFWNVERNERVSDETLARVAGALGVPLRDLDADAAERIAKLAEAV
jgi:transcriptional regulator with XRE-family HTH domain